jgi:hypothetical protein
MKTSNINIKDILKKLNIFKNNLALLVPILIAVVAILLFVPTSLLSGRLRQTIDQQSVQASKQIDGLIKNVDQAAEAEAMEPYINACEQDATAMDNLMKQTTLRELLDYKVFADPNQTSQLVFDPFRLGFVSGVEAMLKSLKAGGPPTDAEIYAALDASSPRSMFGRSRPRSLGAAGGGLPGRGLNLLMMTEMDRKFVAKICEDKAKAAKVYASPADLGGYVFWSDWKFVDWDKAFRDCWCWQMAYWVLEDVATTVRQMNKDAENVLTSPVKRIMSTAFTQSRAGRAMIGGRGGRRATAPKDKQTPNYVTSIRNAMTGSPCTGRFCNEQFDVMQFQVRVIVNAADVMHFMQELCSAKTHKFRGWLGDQPEQTYKHNQISILESSITPVDREDYNHSSYVYGEDEVVDVDLTCEYVFYKAAYETIKPQVVKTDIATPAQTGKR